MKKKKPKTIPSGLMREDNNNWHGKRWTNLWNGRNACKYRNQSLTWKGSWRPGTVVQTDTLLSDDELLDMAK